MLPLVPRYLVLGKGYAINPNELQLVTDIGGESAQNTAEGAIMVGDYHNGPLSVVIPLGIAGVIGFLWFLAAGYRMLLNNFRHGDAEVRQINAFLLSYFVARVVFFVTIFGSLHGELAMFTGLIGLSVSINGGMCQPAEAPVEKPAFSQLKLARAIR